MILASRFVEALSGHHAVRTVKKATTGARRTTKDNADGFQLSYEVKDSY